MSTLDDARRLLGQEVIVKLDDTVVASGKLIAFNDGGEATLVDDMGFVHSCWPMLDIKPATPENVEEPT